MCMGTSAYKGGYINWNAAHSACRVVFPDGTNAGRRSYRAAQLAITRWYKRSRS